MRSILIAALLSFLVGSEACAQWANVGDPTSPKPAEPIPLNARDWRAILRPQQTPTGAPCALYICGDGKRGYGWFYNPYNGGGKMDLMPPPIQYGPSAYNGGPLGLIQNGWTQVYGSVGSGGNSFSRQWMAAYVPRGNYVGTITFQFASGSVSPSTYTGRVLMGSATQTSGAQQGLLIVPVVATNATTAAGNNTLHFASTTGIQAGMAVYDITTKAAIPTGLTVTSVTSTTAVMSGNAAGAGVGNGDSIEFGFVIGHASHTWTGGSSTVESMTFSFNTFGAACNAVANSNEQCEILAEIYTTDNGANILSGGGATSTPPYTTVMVPMRMDDNRGAN